MSYEIAAQFTHKLFLEAAPVLLVKGIDGAVARWCRNVADDDERRGPWRVPMYEVLDRDAWEKRAPCLYLVRGCDDGFRYVGISKNRLKDRWRLSPAYDQTGSRPLGAKHLFHSRCWPEMEGEFERKPEAHFEIRVGFVPVLRTVLPRIVDQRSEIPSLSGLCDEAVPWAMEKWLRGSRRVTFGVSFLPWNKN